MKLLKCKSKLLCKTLKIRNDYVNLRSQFITETLDQQKNDLCLKCEYGWKNLLHVSKIDVVNLVLVYEKAIT